MRGHADELVLAFCPNTRGFGFVLFEGPFAPVDWGVVWLRGTEKNRIGVQRLAELLARQRPDVVLLEDMFDGTSRRHDRIRELNAAAQQAVSRAGIECVHYSQSQVRAQFAELGAFKRYARAMFIARRIPEFERLGLLPPPRKIWNSENPRMAIFDAAALAITFFQEAEERQFEA
jgi:LmbE family N-acetylglucosaminyl deacetylase